jgi:hypothetical protein
MELSKSKEIGEMLEKLACRILTDISSTDNADRIVESMITHLSSFHSLPKPDPCSLTDILADEESRLAKLKVSVDEARRTLQ